MMPAVFKLLLQPFAAVYALATAIRNLLYTIRVFKSTEYPLPIVCIGNLNTGGTGKTPMIAYLLNLWKEKATVVSRGYGRKTTGLMQVKPGMTATECGDEPLMLQQQFGDKITILLAEKRLQAIDSIVAQTPAPGLLLLDDAFQHRSVKAGLNLLLTDFFHPFYADQCLPAGRLREGRHGAVRAQAVIVTKCPPNLNEAAQQAIVKQIRRYTTAPVFFAGLQYEKVQNAAGEILPPHAACCLLTGIANPRHAAEYMAANYQVKHHFRFADHHQFTPKEIEVVAARKLPVVTTAKDWVRLQHPSLLKGLNSLEVFVLPVKHRFLSGSTHFDPWFLHQVQAL